MGVGWGGGEEPSSELLSFFNSVQTFVQTKIRVKITSHTGKWSILEKRDSGCCFCCLITTKKGRKKTLANRHSSDYSAKYLQASRLHNILCK